MRERGPSARPIGGSSDSFFANNFRSSSQAVEICCEASCLMLKFPTMGPESRNSSNAQAACLIGCVRVAKSKSRRSRRQSIVGFERCKTYVVP